MEIDAPALKETAQPQANGAKILVVEDDVPLAHFLRRGLEANNYCVTVAHEAESALADIFASCYDLLVTDLNLPRIDGVALIRQVSATVPKLPILVLSARAAIDDRIATLDSGADDYLVKPFSLQELLARTRALLRRNGRSPRNIIQVDDLLLSRPEFRVERAGKIIELTAKEFDLLECLMINAHQVVSRAAIMEKVWRTTYDGTSNLVDVYVKYVRDKVDAGYSKKLVRTIRGVGYMLTDTGRGLSYADDVA
ncbi:MAG: response regulator transcription factor [Acidobacteria bacterium]|nr:response regulator transcription factor [Acidobacteriota bacterium]